jgi:hypothetical protein
MFYVPGHIFGSAEGDGSCFPDLRSRTHFQRFRGRRVPFSSFAHTYLFSAVSWASTPIFLFCAPELVFGWYRGRWVPFLCFALTDSFSAVLRTSGPVFMFCIPGLIFGGNEGVNS